MRRAILWLPLALFATFLGLAASELSSPSERILRSGLVGNPMPGFTLSAAVPDHRSLASADLARGGPRLVNVFASWCLPCITEAPALMELKRRGVPIDGIAIRDRPADVTEFLARYGDPYDRIGADPNSAVQMALGSAGVPETFVVDGRGIIRKQHIGPIGPQDMVDIIAAWETAR